MLAIRKRVSGRTGTWFSRSAIPKPSAQTVSPSTDTATDRPGMPISAIRAQTTSRDSSIAADHCRGVPAVRDGLGTDPRLGFYGPASEMWRVNREAVLLGSGPAALLLQLAHPLVAEGVAAHSDFAADPFARLRRTLRTTLAMVFGDGPTAERAIAELNRVHARVRGPVLDPRSVAATGAHQYRALDPALLLWVQATLVITSVHAYDRWVAPLAADERDRLWLESRVTGQLLGIPLAASPPSWPELIDWFEQQMTPGGPVVVTDTARRLAGTIIRPPLPWAPGALVDLAVLPGLGLLPPAIREGYGIPWSARRAALAGALSTGVRTWVRLTPRSWRAMPPARAAERRVAAGVG